MTSSSSVISVSNRALLMAGARTQISSLTEGSTASIAVNALFQPTFEQLARTAPWSCLRKQSSLTMIQAAQGTPENQSGTAFTLPPVPWLYAYSYPPDCLYVRQIVPSYPSSGTSSLTTQDWPAQTFTPNGGAINYAVAYQTDISNNPIETVLTNQDQAIAIYTVNQANPQIWDSLFEHAFVASLAAFLVPALSLQPQLLQLNIGMAEKAIQNARARDANEGVHTQDSTPDWIRARGGNWAYGTLYDDYMSQNMYSNMFQEVVHRG